MRDKKCVFILPYFGEFNNYFQLFLNSFSYNKSFELYIFTDNLRKYDYPSNVRVIPFSLEKVRESIEAKLNMKICLNAAYKLCDFKPTYGMIFQEYIKDFEYWGHCDCDLIFGNLEKLLMPLLNEGYDKIFAAGHLTIYKNSEVINKLFMHEYKGRYIYKEAFSSDSIYVFDEDFKDYNVHRIFLENGLKVFDKDMSMNPTSKKAHFIRSYYSPHTRKFEWENKIRARYYWKNGNVFSLYVKDGKLEKTDYLYMHLQSRTMHMKKNVFCADCVQIKPDSFIVEKNIPDSVRNFNPPLLWLPNRFWIDTYYKKVRKKIKGFAL